LLKLDCRAMMGHWILHPFDSTSLNGQASSHGPPNVAARDQIRSSAPGSTRLTAVSTSS
jgi:hypothetical protein